MDKDWNRGGFGIYVHWPFCQSKCPYCDFNSHVVSSVDTQAWSNAYVSEVRRYGRETPQRIVNSVFFGGGTPSLMSPSTVSNVLEAIQQTWNLANDIEITIEANPNSVEVGKFQAFRAAGVNRVSVGIQSLKDKDLRQLGRLHSVAEGLAAIDVARSVFDRVSFDLIYARQDQSLTEWQQELHQAISMGTDHLSLYELTIEAGTAFGKRHDAGKLSGLPNDGLSADMYAMTQEMTESAGLFNYEISNHARLGAESIHNQIYWNAGDYVGIGPGAHGRLTLGDKRFATETPLSPNVWLNSALSGTGETSRIALTPLEQAEEYLMMSLRLRKGSNLKRLSDTYGFEVLPHRIESLVSSGHLWSSGSMIGATAAGRILLNALLRELILSD